MSTPYIGEIRILPFQRGAPLGWQVCDGSMLSVAQETTLYSLIGTTYGGDGVNTFAVPDLRGRVPVHQGAGRGLTPRSIGEAAGNESVTLSVQQMASHGHVMLASTTPATSTSPANTVLAALPTSLNEGFFDTQPTAADAVTFPATMVQPAGGSQPHDNTAPTLTLQYCIATEGVWPPRP